MPNEDLLCRFMRSKRRLQQVFFSNILPVYLCVVNWRKDNSVEEFVNDLH